MEVIILAGGKGTRMSEETHSVPKPMVEINGKPMLWHIMNIYAEQGYKSFTIATGYLSHVIEEWTNSLKVNWSVKTLFTGLDTQTGGRIKRCIESLDDDNFLATYGDGLANVNIKELIQFHSSYRFAATLTAVRPPARFGSVELSGNKVSHFGEKNQADSGWINGGFFVLNRTVASLIEGDHEPLESGAFPRLVASGTLGGFTHFGFWQPIDTLREKKEMELFARETPPPWLIPNTQFR